MHNNGWHVRLCDMCAYHPQLLEHYRALYEKSYHSSASALVQSEFPRLAPGLIGSALHPLIHMGYGLNVGIDEMVMN